jgi:hypothetical protein
VNGCVTDRTGEDYRYQVGGSLSWDAQSYVMRQADVDLLDALKSNELCYIFNARQMGKSSLRVRAMHTLQKQGFQCGVIDMTLLGSYRTTPEQWYASFACSIAQCFKLDVRVPEWWRAHNELSLTRRLTNFLELTLEQISGPMVIFLDEIDHTLGLSFNLDGFFGLIRATYERRSSDPLFQRLNWVLLGVTTPSDLIQNRAQSGFSLGRAIELKGFQEHEVFALAQGLAGKVTQPMVVLREILYWTDGQPFLTQKICDLAAQTSRSSLQGQLYLPPGTEAYWIEQLIYNHIVQNWESQDNPEHLRHIRDRILKSQRGALLLDFCQTLLDESIPLSPAVQVIQSSVEVELLLTGLVSRTASGIAIKNRLYRNIFSPQWVLQQQTILKSIENPNSITARSIAAQLKASEAKLEQLQKAEVQQRQLRKSLETELQEVIHQNQALQHQIQRRLRKDWFKFVTIFVLGLGLGFLAHHLI